MFPLLISITILFNKYFDMQIFRIRNICISIIFILFIKSCQDFSYFCCFYVAFFIGLLYLFCLILLDFVLLLCFVFSFSVCCFYLFFIVFCPLVSFGLVAFVWLFFCCCCVVFICFLMVAFLKVKCCFS